MRAMVRGAFTHEQMRATAGALGRLRGEPLAAAERGRLLAAFRDWRAGR